MCAQTTSDPSRPDLQKLRRFAIAIALVLITYSMAGIELEAPAQISPLGLPLRISRPELLPLGLMITSGYALLAFLYYGFMLSPSPARKRRQWRAERGIQKVRNEQEIMMETAQGSDKAPYTPDDLFPAIMKHKAMQVGRNGEDEQGRYWEREVLIPPIVRVASRLEEVNYSAPVWLNALAIGSAIWRLTT